MSRGPFVQRNAFHSTTLPNEGHPIDYPSRYKTWISNNNYDDKIQQQSNCDIGRPGSGNLNRSARGGFDPIGMQDSDDLLYHQSASSRVKNNRIFSPMIESSDIINWKNLIRSRLSRVTYVQAFQPPLQTNKATTTCEDSSSLMLNPDTLNKILKLPESVQTSILKIIEQQNQIRLLELQMNKEKTILPNLSKAKEGIRHANNRTSHQSVTCDTSSSQSTNKRNETPPRRRLTPSSTPLHLNVFKKLGLKGEAPVTLDEIKKINEENLKLASNGHIAATMKPAAAETSSDLIFTDEEDVKQKLLVLNPNWRGSSEELLAAMKAHLNGVPVTFTNDNAQKSGFHNVCQIHTHTIQIESVNNKTKKVRDIHVIKVHEDPQIAPHWKMEDGDENSQQDFTHKGIAKLPRGQTEIFDRLIRRSAAALQVPEDDIEDAYLLRYKQGEGSEPHLEGISRRSTLIVYLNELSDGGETDFPKLGYQIRPQTGTAIVWHNVKVSSDSTFEEPKCQNQIREDRLLHASLPVKGEEEKFVVVVYVINRGI